MKKSGKSSAASLKLAVRMVAESQGQREGVTGAEAMRIQELERLVREPRKANESSWAA